MTILEVQQHIEGITAEIENLSAVPADAMTYSELKMQLMVNYVANLSFYVSLKHRGVKVSDHPVFAHLAYLRTFMERLAPLDASLKYLIEKLLLAEETLEEEASTAAGSAAGPNLAAFVKNHIMVDQVRKQQTSMELGSSSNHRMEIDPAMIAAQIQKAQQQGGNKRRKPVKTYVEEDSEREEESEPEPEPEPEPKPSRKSHKQSKKTKVSSDDEEIDSDFEL